MKCYEVEATDLPSTLPVILKQRPSAQDTDTDWEFFLSISGFFEWVSPCHKMSQQ